MVKVDLTEWKFKKYVKSSNSKKMYDAIYTSREDPNKTKKISFGDPKMENYQDKTGLNAYPNLSHGDKVRRRNFRNRFSGLKAQQNWKRYHTALYHSWTKLW